MVNEEEEEEEDISYSAVAKLTTKERHKYTQSSGDGCMVGRTVGGAARWDGKALLSRFEKMTLLPPCRRKRISRRDGAGQAVVHVECGAIWLLAMRFLNSLRGYILT